MIKATATYDQNDSLQPLTHAGRSQAASIKSFDWSALPCLNDLAFARATACHAFDEEQARFAPLTKHSENSNLRSMASIQNAHADPIVATRLTVRMNGGDLAARGSIPVQRTAHRPNLTVTRYIYDVRARTNPTLQGLRG